jgi:lysophospholipase L1-like esterase
MKDKKKYKFFIFFGIAFVAALIGLRDVEAVRNENPSGSSETELTYEILPADYQRTSALSFIRDTLCFIHDPSNSMSDVINWLNEVLLGKDTIINIVHLGDSHIQAGYLSGHTMRLLQRFFGNAGRGWIAPFKLSKLNEPSDYFILSNVKDWISGRCIQQNPKCAWGIGGIGIQTRAKDIDFRLIMSPNNGAGYSFNKVLLFRDLKSNPMSHVAIGSEQETLLFQGIEPQGNILIDTFKTANLMDTLSLKSIKTQPQVTASLYYGFMLMNGNPGVLYHAIGVNGAKFTDYTSREYVRQLSLLNPSLLIISLGTNEAFGRNFNKEAFEKQVHSLIQLVRSEIPETAILITTPIETYKSIYVNNKRQYIRNENFAKIAETLASYSARESLALLDMYAIGGGDHSSKNWYEAKLFGADRIHFSREGYIEQGALLYKAIIRSCISGLTTERERVDWAKVMIDSSAEKVRMVAERTCPEIDRMEELEGKTLYVE